MDMLDPKYKRHRIIIILFIVMAALFVVYKKYGHAPMDKHFIIYQGTNTCKDLQTNEVLTEEECYRRYR